jgi:putative acetyltransferase
VTYHNQEFEILKLAVQPEFQGNGIGKALVKHAIDYAKLLNVNRIVLDSNSQLKTAIRLYQDFGFKFISPRGYFATADVAMELRLV